MFERVNVSWIWWWEYNLIIKGLKQRFQTEKGPYVLFIWKKVFWELDLIVI